MSKWLTVMQYFHSRIEVDGAEVTALLFIAHETIEVTPIFLKFAKFQDLLRAFGAVSTRANDTSVGIAIFLIR